MLAPSAFEVEVRANIKMHGLKGNPEWSLLDGFLLLSEYLHQINHWLL